MSTSTRKYQHPDHPDLRVTVIEDEEGVVDEYVDRVDSLGRVVEHGVVAP